MKTLHQLLRLRNKYEGALFGVEIETEGHKLPDRIPQQWGIKEDGSLRGRFPDQAAEYVMNRPLSLENSIEALKDLRKAMDENGAEFNYSFRTSVHVHLNVSDLTSEQYLNTVYTYLLLENVFVRYCGNERVGNRFCLRYQDAENLGGFLIEMFRNGAGFVNNAEMHHLKYAALNIAATPRYGSLEFRAMQGNLEVPYITVWLRAIDCVRKYAIAHANPQAIHDKFVKLGGSEFMKDVLGALYPFFSHPDEDGDLALAFSITIELPHAYQNEKMRLQRIEEMLAKEQAELVAQVERKLAQRKQVAMIEAGLDDGEPIEMHLVQDVEHVDMLNEILRRDQRVNQINQIVRR